MDSPAGPPPITATLLVVEVDPIVDDTKGKKRIELCRNPIHLKKDTPSIFGWMNVRPRL